MSEPFQNPASSLPEGQCASHWPFASMGCPTCGDAPVPLRGWDWPDEQAAIGKSASRGGAS